MGCSCKACLSVCLAFPDLGAIQLANVYRVSKNDFTQEMEQRVQWTALAWADHCALYSISCVQSYLLTQYFRAKQW